MSRDEKLVQVAERLRQLMSERSVSQNELARRTGFSVQSVSLWCTGKNGMTLDAAAKVADALDVSIDEIVGR